MLLVPVLGVRLKIIREGCLEWDRFGVFNFGNDDVSGRVITKLMRTTY